MYTVLFADDTDIVRTALCAALRHAGYSVLEAGDGCEALSLARGHAEPIDLLITDVLMPRMGGLELRRALKTCHPESSVLFISGYSEDALELSGPFLQKPFSPAVLLSRASGILARRETQPGS